MSVPNEHISDNLSVRNIAVSSNSTLQIKSMVSSLFVMFPAFLTDFPKRLMQLGIQKKFLVEWTP